jgi:Pentapeptide repeats (8 copies)
LSDKQNVPKWGDPISSERQAELQGYLDRWQAEADHGDRNGPFAQVQLTGADVYWLAKRSRRNRRGRLSHLHLEGADLCGAHLEKADLRGAMLVGADLRDACLEGADLRDACLEGVVFSRPDMLIAPGILESTDFDPGIMEALPDFLDFFDISEQAAFTSYYPREVAPEVWDRLLVFIALNTAEATALVEVTAAESLQRRHEQLRVAKAPTRKTLKPGTRFTISPNLPGFRFDPVSITTGWTSDVQCHEFRVRAEETSPGRAAHGQITILEGPLLRGEIPLTVLVRQARQRTPDWSHFTDERLVAFRDTFPSYSTKDKLIERACETAMEAGGDRFVSDVHKVRAEAKEGDPKLLELIEQADVFQLFWSKNAAESQQVEHEWRHALTLRATRPNLIRLVYWTAEPYPIPSDLEPIDRGHLDPQILGMPRSSWLSRIIGREG